MGRKSGRRELIYVLDNIHKCQCHKRYFLTKKEAQWEAKRRTTRDGEEWASYKCPFFNKVWHIGHVRAKPEVTRERQRGQVFNRLERLGYIEPDMTAPNS